jgi:hypothetical protein
MAIYYQRAMLRIFAITSVAGMTQCGSAVGRLAISCCISGDVQTRDTSPSATAARYRRSNQMIEGGLLKGLADFGCSENGAQIERTSMCPNVVRRAEFEWEQLDTFGNPTLKSAFG